MMKEIMPTFKNQIIFYSNLSADQKQLSNHIYNIASCLPQKKIVIDDMTFFKFFNIAK
jgi:hypothetical protein